MIQEERTKTGNAEQPSILDLAKRAKTENLDMAELLKEHYIIEEVAM